MNIVASVPRTRIVMVSALALTLSACGSSGSYRIASIGDVPGGATGDSGSGTGGGGTSDGGGTPGGGGTGSGGTGGGGTGTGGTGTGTGGAGTGGTGTAAVGPLGTVLVSAGNATIGLAGKHNALAETVNHTLPVATPVTGTVTGVLAKTGQTLVDLGSGRTAVLNSAKGILGEVVTLNLGSGNVVGASKGSSLLGVGVLSATPASGSLASVNLGTGAAGGGLVGGLTGGLAGGGTSGGVVNTVATTVNGVVGGVTSGVNGATAGGGTGVVGTVVNGVTGKAGSLLGGAQNVGLPAVVPAVTGTLSAAGGTTATTPAGTATTRGVLNLGGLLGKK